MSVKMSIATAQQRREAAFIIPGQREAKTSSETSRRCNRQRVETWHAEQAHTEHVLKLRRALTLTLSRAGAPQHCATQRRDGAHLTCAAAGMTSPPWRTTAARARRPSPSKKSVKTLLKEASQPSGRSHPRETFLFRVGLLKQVRNGQFRRGPRLGALAAAHLGPRASLECFA